LGGSTIVEKYLEKMKHKVTKAIFPVAGQGTRFLPATKSIPKEIMTLVDRPLVQYAIDEARAAGIKEFIFVTSRGKGALEDYFDEAPELERYARIQFGTKQSCCRCSRGQKPPIWKAAQLPIFASITWVWAMLSPRQNPRCDFTLARQANRGLVGGIGSSGSDGAAAQFWSKTAASLEKQPS